jgi:hypothetical protein
LIQCHQLAVDYGIAPGAFECSSNFDVAVVDDLAVATVEGNLAADYRWASEAMLIWHERLEKPDANLTLGIPLFASSAAAMPVLRRFGSLDQQ